MRTGLKLLSELLLVACAVAVGGCGLLWGSWRLGELVGGKHMNHTEGAVILGLMIAGFAAIATVSVHVFRRRVYVSRRGSR